MKTKKSLRPGDNGTKKFVNKYGNDLFCVRYRYDSESGIRYTTVELIEDKAQVRGTAPKKKMAKMEEYYPDEDVRLLRKILEGLDYLYNSDSVTSKLVYTEGVRADDNHSENLRLLLELNKVEQVIDRIFYIEAKSPYCRIVFDAAGEKVLEIRVTLQQLEDYFPENVLLRVHRSFIINPERVLCIQKHNKRNQIWLKDSFNVTKSLPITHTYISRLKKFIPPGL